LDPNFKKKFGKQFFRLLYDQKNTLNPFSNPFTITVDICNFERPYLSNVSPDPLRVWFYGGVFLVGGSNGATSGWIKFKMAAGRHF